MVRRLAIAPAPSLRSRAGDECCLRRDCIEHVSSHLTSVAEFVVCGRRHSIAQKNQGDCVRAAPSVTAKNDEAFP
jgi:hypothetical protein